MLRRRLSAGFFLALSLLAVTAQAETGSRLEWQTQACRLSWHRNCSFAPRLSSAEAATSHRFVTLEANLRTFAPSDACLYAVYLTGRSDLDALRASLRQAGAPRPWETQGRAISAAPVLGRISCEWICLEPNGHLTVRVDEANQSGKNWVAVVNSEGEILGARPLWAGDDVAELR